MSRRQHPIIPADDLPCPRIELRWRDMTDEERQKHPTYYCICDYDLIIGLDEYDIRAEDKEGHIGKGSREMRLNVHRTISSGSAASRRRGDYLDGPFRDGAHASWDGAQLGRPPIYVVVGNDAQLIDYPDEAKP